MSLVAGSAQLSSLGIVVRQRMIMQELDNFDMIYLLNQFNNQFCMAEVIYKFDDSASHASLQHTHIVICKGTSHI